MFALQVQENIVGSKRIKISDGFFVTPKDLEVMKFLMEMKFSSVQELHFKFFRKLRNGKESHSLWWAKERLQTLWKNNYLKKEFCRFGKEIYFLPTKKAQLLISRKYPEIENLRASEKIDPKFFDHDKTIVKLRLEIEEAEKVKKWISDKELHVNIGLFQGLEKTNIPDGIFIKEDGAKVAIEVEIARKCRTRYLEKINKFVQIMRSGNGEAPFHKVIYFCAKESVYRTLKNETRIYGDLFTVIHGLTYLNRENN